MHLNHFRIKWSLNIFKQPFGLATCSTDYIKAARMHGKYLFKSTSNTPKNQWWKISVLQLSKILQFSMKTVKHVGHFFWIIVYLWNRFESMVRANALWNNRNFLCEKENDVKTNMRFIFSSIYSFLSSQIASMQFFNWENEMYSSRKLIVCCLTWLSVTHLNWNGISPFFGLRWFFRRF